MNRRAAVTEAESAVARAPAVGALSGGRLVSLDAFRGIAIAGMILVNNPGSWSYVYAPLAHAPWHGWTPTDLIFPFFLFIVGVAMPFSFSRRLERSSSRRALFFHVVRRSLIIIALGLLLHGFPRYDFSTIRIPGVLQRIGVVYFFASTAYLVLKARARWVLAAVLLLGYWALMTLVPVPGYGAGDLSKEGNLAAYVDNLLFRGHMWEPAWDPEGVLSTLPAIVTALLGVFTGEWLLSARSRLEKLVGLFVAANAGLVLGLIWDAWFPINKNLWTSSYVLFTAGMGLHTLAMCYWAIDVRGSRAWASPFVVYGMNAIAVYVLSAFVSRVLILWKVPGAGGEAVPLKAWIYQNLFASWAGPLNGSLAFAVAYVLFWLGVVWLMYRRRIFIKI